MLDPKTIKAKILKVSAVEGEGPEEREYSYTVWELPGGLIEEPGTDTPDIFYADRNSIKASGLGEITEIEDTGETISLEVIDVIKSLAASYNDFGCVPEEAWEFIIGNF